MLLKSLGRPFSMGTHIPDVELDKLHTWAKGLTPIDMHRRMNSTRITAGEHGPSLVAARHALRGVIFRRSKMETQGLECEPPRGFRSSFGVTLCRLLGYRKLITPEQRSV